jgi:hypothetical protein
MSMVDITDRLIAAVKGYVRDAVASLDPRFAALEKRVDALEKGSASAKRFDCGKWRAQSIYGAGACVTHDGRTWISEHDDVTHEPGAGGGWREAE